LETFLLIIFFVQGSNRETWPHNAHLQYGLKLKVLTLVLIPNLHLMIVPQHLQIFNQMPEITVDVIPTLLWP
jgi:hypothetical protein